MLEQLVISFIASAGFGIVFNVPKDTLLKCGFVGMLGWLVYLLLTGRGFDEILASLGASIVVTALSQVFARLYKTPIIVFSVAGVIPLVPGGLAYDAMRSVVENRYDQAVQLAAKAFMISGAIAIGLMFSEVVYLLLRRVRSR
ncbi:membrane protein [Gordoniibacillus kamchatkensis]|uniref:Membrane protein n=1 Tax=Gordoniibacillus kamchatkensis TaxID=1590651 RepID=A0ABR5AAP5_9BACL|nr:threonine/serine exporter family protein [Paenibacillus sp. VKM B-2647]KIL37913.1 membrane protein [Paenibacillus sp. VKM B-2647]